MTISIREATKDDVELLAQLIRDSFKDVADRFSLSSDNAPTHPSHCTAKWIESALDKGIEYFILESEGKPHGCVALEHASADVCYLERLAVIPEFRQRGFGEALVRHVLEQAKSMGAKRVEIGIIAEQFDLRGWYEKLGFVVKGTKHFDHLPFQVAFMYIEL